MKIDDEKVMTRIDEVEELLEEEEKTEDRMRYKGFGGNEMQSKVKKNRRAYLGVYKKLKEHYKDTIIIADLHSGEIRYKLSSSADY